VDAAAAMSEDARRQVLDGIRRSLRGGGAARAAELEARLRQHPPGPVPKRGQLDARGRVELFVQMAEFSAATVARLRSTDEVPDAVAAYLAGQNLPAQLRLAPDPRVTNLPWARRPVLILKRGRSNGEDLVSLTPVFAAVAETGTLALVSGRQSPTTLNFLPETHLALVDAGQIVGTYEEAWALLRQAYGDGVVPRTVNFVTGPSRSADIEQTLQLGAHGPRRLHILLVDPGPIESAPIDSGRAPGP
jgi:L-lactate dehydrogenase complex protein LldG